MRRQRGVTLIELLVGITIGLLTIAVASGALMVSRGVSGTVSDVSQLQQEAAYLFRSIGQQVRQAGSLRLNLAANQAPNTPPSSITASDPVAFETRVGDFDPAQAISGGDDSLIVGFRSYLDSLNAFSGDGSLVSDCKGQNKAAGDTLIQSTYTFNGPSHELRCAGFQDNVPQPMARNVANFQVRYLQQSATGSGHPLMRYVNAATVGTNWPSVFGAEVCIVLFGNEAIDMPAGTSYIDCDGASVDMTTAPAPRTRRLHMAFRSVFQLRSQGLVGSVS